MVDFHDVLQHWFYHLLFLFRLAKALLLAVAWHALIDGAAFVSALIAAAPVELLLVLHRLDLLHVQFLQVLEAHALDLAPQHVQLAACNALLVQLAAVTV